MMAWLLAAVVTAGPPADLTVVGTIVSARSDRSMALLRSAGRTRTVAAGETAFGGRIVSVARADVERRLGAEIPKILAETTVVPYLDRAQVAGLLVSRMPDGLLSEVGLRPGDVLQSVNEVPVDSVATLASLWPRFQNVSEVRAVVLRDGRPFSLTLALR